MKKTSDFELLIALQNELINIKYEDIIHQAFNLSELPKGEQK